MIAIIKHIKKNVNINFTFYCKIILSFFIFLSLNTILISQEWNIQEDMGVLENTEIKEGSGLYLSQKYEGIFYTHNDSEISKVYAFNSLGKNVAVFTFNNLTNTDWEEISGYYDSVSKKNIIVIGDIGDNSANRSNINFIFFEEPDFDPNALNQNIEIQKYEIKQIQYPDNPKDCEAFIIEPHSHDIFLFAKRETNASIYKLEYPFISNLLTKVGNLKIGNSKSQLDYITGATINKQASIVYIRTYKNVYYYSIGQKDIVSELSLNPIVVNSYNMNEFQGEAITINSIDSSFYTYGEESPLKITPHLLHFTFKNTTNSISESDNFNSELDNISIDMSKISNANIIYFNYLGQILQSKSINLSKEICLNEEVELELNQSNLETNCYFAIIYFLDENNKIIKSNKCIKFLK